MSHQGLYSSFKVIYRSNVLVINGVILKRIQDLWLSIGLTVNIQAIIVDTFNLIAKWVGWQHATMSHPVHLASVVGRNSLPQGKKNSKAVRDTHKETHIPCASQHCTSLHSPIWDGLTLAQSKHWPVQLSTNDPLSLDWQFWVSILCFLSQNSTIIYQI